MAVPGARLVNAMTVDVEDYFQVSAFAPYIRRDEWDRLPGSYHGSGCTLASAVAAWLAQGLEIGAAVHAAQEYTWRTLVNGFRPGMGQFLPDRFFWTRKSFADMDDGGPF